MRCEAEALDVAQRVASRLPPEGIFEGMRWRTTPEPFALPKRLWRELEKLGYRLWKFLRAADLLYVRSVKGSAPAYVARWLDAGKPAEVVALGRERAFRGQLPGVIRPDVLPTAEGFVISELDSTPGGIGLTAWMNQVYSGEGFAVMGGETGMMEGFASLFPQGADVIVSEEAKAYLPEMQWLVGELRRRGLGGGRFEVRGQDFCGPFAPGVYRFFELFDQGNLPCAGPLWEAAVGGRCVVTAPPKAWLEEKLLFALFWLKPLEGFWRLELGSGVFESLRRCIPRTWLLDPAPLPAGAVYPWLEAHSWEEVMGFSQRERQLVIKISGFDETAWGARGVVVGHDVPKEEWARALRRALERFEERPHILQVFHAAEAYPVCTLAEDGGGLEEWRARPRICPYYFVAEGEIRLGGVLVTLCPEDKKILHGMSSAAMCPASAAPREE